MIIVQFLATYKDPPGNNVRRCVRTLEIPITPEMTNAIDYPRCEERYPQHLYSEDHNSNASEENDVGDGNNDNAGEQESRIDVSL